MQTKPTLTLAALALSAAAALGTSAYAQTAPSHARAPGIVELEQAAINNILKHDKAVIVAPRVTECGPPGFFDSAIAPSVQEVCTATAKVFILPRKP